MSKLSFRARALDATKPLPIYHAVDLPDISEYNTINRTVPQMPTGMEKEEETVCHLPQRLPFFNAAIFKMVDVNFNTYFSFYRPYSVVFIIWKSERVSLHVVVCLRLA